MSPSRRRAIGAVRGLASRTTAAPSPRLTRAAAPHRPWRLATAVRGLASRTTTAHPSPLPAPLHTPWRARSLPGRRDRDIAPYRHYTRVIRPPPRPLPRLTRAPRRRAPLAAPYPRRRAASPVAARHWLSGLPTGPPDPGSRLLQLVRLNHHLDLTICVCGDFILVVDEMEPIRGNIKVVNHIHLIQ